MVSGRKPKPTWLKVVSGNPGNRPLNVDEPQPQGDILEPPDWMDETHRKEWAAALKAAPQGLLRTLDTSIFTVWVCAKVLHADAARRVSQYGALIKTPVTGAPMQSPYVSIMNKQAAIISRSAAEMGFSPSSRSRVSVQSKRKGKAETPFDDLKELGD